MEGKIIDEIWNYPGNNPSWKTNYNCNLKNSGKWKIESEKFNKLIYGKWILVVSPKKEEGFFPSPTFADQNNFMSALLEIEWRNDNFKFEDGLNRCSCWGKKPTHYFLDRLDKFQQTLDFYKSKYNGQVKLSYFENED